MDYWLLLCKFCDRSVIWKLLIQNSVLLSPGCTADFYRRLFRTAWSCEEMGCQVSEICKNVCRKKYFQRHPFDRRTGERRFWSMQVFPPGYLLYIRDSTSLPSYIGIHEIMIPNNQKIMPWDFQKFQDFCYDHRMRRSLLMSLQKEKTEKSSGEEWLGSACVYMFYCTKVLGNSVCNS